MVIMTQRFLCDGQRSYQKLFGFDVTAHVSVQQSQIAKGGADTGMGGTQRLLAPGQCGLEEWLRLSVAPQILIDRRKPRDRRAIVRVLFAKALPS